MRLPASIRVMALLLGGLAFLGSIPIAPNARTDDPKPPSLEEPAKSFLAKHCHSCHTGEKPKGGFRADRLTADFTDKANRERWQAALEQAQSGTMPPKEKPRPAEKD